MFCASIKELNRLKQINRLLKKGMSNIYLKVTVEKNWRSQNFNFLSLKLTQISLNFKTSCSNLKIRDLGAKLCVAFILFQFWKGLWHFKVKESMHFVEQKYKL